MTQFVIDGISCDLPSTPFTIGGNTFDVPVMNLETQLLATEVVLPTLGQGDAVASCRAYVSVMAKRMSSVDGSPITEAYIYAHTAGKGELDQFVKDAQEWLILSGFLKRAGEGEQQPGGNAPPPAN